MSIFSSTARVGSATLVVLTLAALLAAVPFVMQNLSLADGLGRTDDYIPFLTIVPLALASGVIGFVIVFNIPSNIVGWLFLGAAATFALGTLANNVAIDAVNQTAPAADGWTYISVSSSFLFVSGLHAVVGALVFFPNGALLGRKWRWVVVLMVLSLFGSQIVTQLGGATEAPLLEGYTSLFDNPPLTGVGLSILEAASVALSLVLISAAAVSLVVRYRRGDAEQREQLKWIALAATVLAVVITVDVLLPPHPLINIADGMAFTAIPIAAGIAITKYRLYDIDIIISRTLVYGPLTAVLAGTYTAAILFFRLIFVDVLDVDSDAAVATTTLAVAAMFIPVKNRLQTFVDRFFKEDERKRLDAFRREMGRTADMLDVRNVAKRFAEHVSATTGGPVRVTLNGHEATVEHPDDVSIPDGAQLVPLVHGDSTLGRVEVGGTVRPAHLTAIEQASGELARIAALRQR